MTAETKFTPGPWRWLPDRNKVRRIFGASDNQVATASVFANFQPVERSKVAHATADANAHLITTAPELYEAAEPLEGWFEHFVADAAEWRENDSVQIQLSIKELRAIKAALVKARGES